MLDSHWRDSSSSQLRAWDGRMNGGNPGEGVSVLAELETQMGLVYWGLLFKTESVRLIEVCVLAECCSSLLTAHNEISLFVFLWHFAVKTPTKGTRILARAALHLGVNFCRMLSFPINYRMSDSQFCHLLWAPLDVFPGCAVLF